MGRNLKLVAAAALLAIAAVEFALLGIGSTAGANDGARRLPPVIARGARLTATVASTHAPAPSLTPPPAVTATPRPPLSPPPVDLEHAPAMVNIFPHPRSVPCDGETASLIETTWRDASGDLVPDGTWVYFWTDGNASVDPYSAQTVAGVATTSLRFPPSHFHQFVTVWAQAGDLVAGVQMQCAPVPCDGTESPPCPPLSPPPCVPSPGSGPMSPPCPSDPPPSPPDCAISPPPTSPPCAPPTGVALLLDCAPGRIGIQWSCGALNTDGTISVDVVLRNYGDAKELGAFTFDVVDSNVGLLVPSAGSDDPLNSNPDFNEDLDAAFQCAPPPPAPDVGTGAPGTAVSRIACYSLTATFGLPAQSDLRIATIRYDIAGPGVEGFVSLSPVGVTIAGEIFTEIGTCDPVIFVPMDCFGAVIEVSGPPPTPLPPPLSSLSLALDCDADAAGVQSTCSAAPGSTADVLVVLQNSGGPFGLAAFNLAVVNPDRSKLVPLPGADGNLDNNPDFNEEELGGDFNCSLVTTPDSGLAGPEGSHSRLVCFLSGSGAVPADIAGASETVIGTVRYVVPSTATPGDVTLTLDEVDFSMYPDFASLGGCPSGGPVMTCTGATIAVVGAASGAPGTATPQPDACTADVNGDGRVSVRDLRQVAHAVARAYARGFYDARYDVSGDGRLTPRDILLTWRQLGRRC